MIELIIIIVALSILTAFRVPSIFAGQENVRTLSDAFPASELGIKNNKK